MTAPTWINAVIGDFGRAAGIGGGLALNERGAAALNFETGASLRLEYTGEELVMAMTFPSPDVKRLLALSHPKSNSGFRIRAGILSKSGRGVIAVRMKEREVTLPRVNAAFSVLWRFAGETGGTAWA